MAPPVLTLRCVLDLARLERVNLHRTPWGQLLMAQVLRLDYRFPRRTKIVLEGPEHLESGQSYILAMNHTDRYNYWPFQYQLYRQRLGYTATWVKGKYYENLSRPSAHFRSRTLRAGRRSSRSAWESQRAKPSWATFRRWIA